jgi:hypothetical protein
MLQNVKNAQLTLKLMLEIAKILPQHNMHHAKKQLLQPQKINAQCVMKLLNSEH